MKEQDNIKTIISFLMCKTGITSVDISARKIMSRPTFYAKQRDPTKYTVGELQKLGKALGFEIVIRCKGMEEKKI